MNKTELISKIKEVVAAGDPLKTARLKRLVDSGFYKISKKDQASIFEQEKKTEPTADKKPTNRKKTNGTKAPRKKKDSE
jgi:hypothetical protein